MIGQQARCRTCAHGRPFDADGECTDKCATERDGMVTTALRSQSNTEVSVSGLVTFARMEHCTLSFASYDATFRESGANE
jgi:hypothetical protein